MDVPDTSSGLDNWIKEILEWGFHEGWQLITPENIAQALGAIAAALAEVFSLAHIARHILYNKTALRSCTIRLLFIVPIFALDSWSCLMVEASAMQWTELLTCVREIYEAVALAAFMEMVLIILGGPEQLAKTLGRNQKPVEHLWPVRLAFRQSYRPGADFVLSMISGILQYVIISFAVFGVTFLIWVGRRLGFYGPVVYKVLRFLPHAMKAGSCGWALMCIILLAHEVREHVPRVGLVLKFVAIKGIVFFTFWQGAVIWIFDKSGYLDVFESYVTRKAHEYDFNDSWWSADQVKSGINDLLLCLEVLFFSVLHWYAYPSREVIPLPDSPWAAERWHWMMFIREVKRLRNIVARGSRKVADAGAQSLARLRESLTSERGPEGSSPSLSPRSSP